MNLYSIYSNEESKNLDLRIIKQGFSFWALVFNFFWAIYHKMWSLVVLFAVFNLLMFLFQTPENMVIIESIKYAVQIFVFGFFATELREFYARKRGMKLDDIILANSEEEAELKYRETHTLYYYSNLTLTQNRSLFF
jgi:hypothetical protein